MSSVSAVISLDNVSKHYREGERTHRVIDRASAAIHPGEITVLLGRSGSGKSTLLNLISGIESADAGDITVAGTSLSRLSERERTLFRRRHIGFVFQFFNLIPTLTVEENVRLPLELNGRRREGARVHTLLAQVGLADRARGFPDRLSGGEQQRVAIARALVHEPALLLADEPTGNLDADTGDQVLQLLHERVRASGATLLMVTHSTEAMRLADRVLTLRDGRLATEPSRLAPA